MTVNETIIIRGSKTTVVGITENQQIAFKINKQTWQGKALNQEYEKVMNEVIKLMNPTKEEQAQ